jgi:hypothetical protein
VQRSIYLACLLLCSNFTWAGEAIEIVVNADPGNPTVPQMGDRLQFESIIANNTSQPAQGLVAWVSLIEVTPGQEQSVDLEDWSAHKAEIRPSLAAGESFRATWPMRLIKAGDYRVVISAVERNASHIVTSPFLDFHVLQKPVIESSRILPVAFGMPLLIGGLLAWRIKRRH